MVKIYKKKYGQTFASKDKNSKHDYKNLKDLDYQLDQLQQSDHPQQSDQPIPEWLKATESRLDGIRSMIIEGKKKKLETTVGKKKLH